MTSNLPPAAAEDSALTLSVTVWKSIDLQHDHRSSGPERTGTSAVSSRGTRCVLPVLLLLGRMYLEEPVYGLCSSCQNGPQFSPVDQFSGSGVGVAC